MDANMPGLIERCFVAWSALAAYLADGWRIVPCFSVGDGRYVEIWRAVASRTAAERTTP